MEDNVKWWGQQGLERTVSALKKHGMEASWVATAEEARSMLLDMIPSGATVGVGGSMTLRQMGLVSALKERGHRVFDHWAPGLSREEADRERQGQATADVFLTGSNAVTVEGELVNIDMAGNRVASTIFGPKKVIVVAGVNKLVRDVAEGMWRTKNVATPPNARRLGSKSPCAQLGYCTDCDSPDRLCRVTTIIERRPARTSMAVILVNEPLGF